MPQAQPELKKYLDKRLFVQLNGSRKVIGVLRGYDVFLNVVLDDAVEEKAGGEKVRLGMVVIRGNSVVMLEALERIGGANLLYPWSMQIPNQEFRALPAGLPIRNNWRSSLPGANAKALDAVPRKDFKDSS
ncbi:MAG: hypothetical protein Q9186_004548 [Xanthomendoza sp. 1 TL-2023]